jgi:hypothetical protein
MEGVSRLALLNSEGYSCSSDFLRRKCSGGNVGASRLHNDSVTHACKTDGPRVTCDPFEFSSQPAKIFETL